MKNFLFVLFGASFLLFSCKSDTLDTPAYEHPQKPDGWRGKLISNDTFELYNASFIKKKLKYKPHKNDTEVFGYKMSEFKEYIAYIDSLARATNVHVDSIQFLLTAYPQDRLKNRFRTIVVKPTFFEKTYDNGIFRDNPNFDPQKLLDENPQDTVQFSISRSSQSPGDINDKVILNYAGCCSGPPN